MSDTDNGTTPSNARQEDSTLGSHVISGRELTHAHYSYIYVHSNAAVVKMVKHQKQQKPPNHVRGVITRFSPRSRSRMIRRTGQIRNLNRPYFITLTYPGLFDVEPERVKAHLFALKKRIKRRFPKAGLLWRLELKYRKSGASQGELAAHYHLVLWGMSIYQSSMYAIINKMWWEIVWSTKEHRAIMPMKSQMTDAQRYHATNGVNVKQLPDFRAVLAYVSKYAAKDEDDETSPEWGRRWGICLNADCSHSYRWGLTWAEHLKLRREIRKVIERRGSAYAWWLKSGYPHLGYSVVGLGDGDEDHDNAIQNTIIRLMAHTKGYTD